MKPSENDVAPLQLWGDRQFADWLRAGLYDYYIRSAGRFAFRPLHAFFAQDYDVVEEFMDVFYLLNEVARTKFRSGLAIALAETDFSMRQVLESILALGRRTHATHLLGVLSESVIAEWERMKDPEIELDHDLAWTVGLLVRYAGDSSLTQESALCLRRLGRSRRIPKYYVEPLFLLLCRISPDSLKENVEIFGPSLGEACQASGAASAEAAPVEARLLRLVRTVMEICGPNALKETLSVRLSSGQVAAGPFRYSWWVQAVFECLSGKSFARAEEGVAAGGEEHQVIRLQAGNGTNWTSRHQSASPLPTWLDHFSANFRDARSAAERSGPAQMEYRT